MLRLLVAVLTVLALPPLAAADAPKAPKADAPAPAKSGAGPGVTAVKEANETISAELKQKAPPNSKEEKELAAKVTAKVRDFLDIEQLGKRAMVDNWSKLTRPQQEQFTKLLRDLIEDNYVRGLRANLSYQVEYIGESTDKDGNLVVATKIKTERKGRAYTIAVDYVLVKEGSRYRAWDVKTDGVGLVENYRTMFNKIIAKDGFDGLMSKMKKKQAQTGT